MKAFITSIVLLLISLPFTSCSQQQEVDRDFTPQISKPLYGQDKGPLMLIDGGHYNFHTLEDKFAPFGKVAAMDGFIVKSISGEIQAGDLKNVKILVIANALNEKNVNSWRQPVYSAFTAEEIKTINSWVKNGGRLFLIADHMPFAGAAANLAKPFGFTFYDGFAMRKPKTKFDMFTFASATLLHNNITDMHGATDSIVTFTGQGFKMPDGATSIITLDSNYKILQPKVAWEFNDQMKITPASGLSQLAYYNYGTGKVVVSGEAAMFTAQRVGEIKIGINSAFAPNNLKLLLNILQWLSE